jgi:ATP-dependent Clp protease ATP-binding subunit ClpA
MDWNSSHENASRRREKLLKLEDELHQSRGQEEAIQAVSDAVRRTVRDYRT